MRLGTEEWLDGAARKAGKLFVKDLGRCSGSAARMMGGALSLRGSDTGGRSTALAAFNQNTLTKPLFHTANSAMSPKKHPPRDRLVI